MASGYVYPQRKLGESPRRPSWNYNASFEHAKLIYSQRFGSCYYHITASLQDWQEAHCANGYIIGNPCIYTTMGDYDEDPTLSAPWEYNEGWMTMIEGWKYHLIGCKEGRRALTHEDGSFRSFAQRVGPELMEFCHG